MIFSIWVNNSDNNLLDLVKQKGWYPYKSMSDFETFQEELPSKEKFYYVLDFNPNLDGGRDGGDVILPVGFPLITLSQLKMNH